MSQRRVYLFAFSQLEAANRIGALLARSFKSLTASLDLTVRGYYAQSILLLRSLIENTLVI